MIRGDTLMVRSGIVMVAALVLLIAIAAPVARSQSENDGAGAPAQKAGTIKGRWTERLVKWRQNGPKLKACRVEARKKGLTGDDRWFFLESCMDKS
jgi:hypothetical protein